VSTTAVRAIGDLPGFFSVVDDDRHLDLLGFPARLMDRGERGLLRVSPTAVVAFRYRDVLDLANLRDVGNMPVDVLAGQSARRETGGGEAGGEPGGAQRAVFLMLADAWEMRGVGGRHPVRQPRLHRQRQPPGADGQQQ
jgi:hypothetical protein